MKLSKWISTFLAVSIGLAALPVFPVHGAETDGMIDSGINYTEATETINNPGAGYTSTLWMSCKPGDTKVYNPTGNLVLIFADIGGFSSGANGTKDEDGNMTGGVDYDLDETFFTNFRKTLENCRRNGCTVAMRFRYDSNGLSNPEPATFEQMERHIRQIQEDGFLEDYKDIIAFVESGFVGTWGEQWGGKYCSFEDKAKVLDLLLDVVPDDIPVTVRTPKTFATWAGIEESQLGEYVVEPGSRASRVGLYNDGYMGSDSDLGTYHDRKRDLTWLRGQTTTSYYGGEFSGNLTFAQKYDTYLPENAVPEMYYTHLSYINANIYQLYKNYTFGAEYDVDGVDNSAYYGETVFQFMRDHLGYRFVLRDSDLSQTVEQDGVLRLSAKIENTGFANPIMHQKAELILEKDGNYVKTPVDLNTQEWYSCTTVSPSLEMKLPGNLEPGDWNVYLKFSVGDNTMEQMSMRSVRFANHDIWNSALGANYMGKFTVTQNADAEKCSDDSFYQQNAADDFQKSDGTLYTTNRIAVTDGASSNAWEQSEDTLQAEKDGNALYVTNDDQYLYVMAEINHNAASPVYNLVIRNQDTGNRYWLYYQNNGFIYFNSGVPYGCVQKHTGNLVEFRIPFGDVMGLETGTTLAEVSVSIQDEADSWKGVGSISANGYQITDDFNVYTASRALVMKQKQEKTLTAYTSGSDLSYQWMKDDQLIEGAVTASYTLTPESEADCGTYSVKITTKYGTEKIVPVAELTQVLSELQTGDINQDGTCNLADLVLLQEYLLNISTLTPEQGALADCTKDQMLDGMDLAVLRQMVLQGNA